MRQVNWGMIGCGDVTEVKSGPPLYKTEDSNLVAIMRRNESLARDYATRHNVPRYYTDVDKLINDPQVNAVYIATPPDTHCEYTLRVAAAGKPVYVEKPMARNYAECLRMVDACDKAGVPLFVAYYRRALPNHLKVKELIDSGAIGQVRFVNVRLYWPLNKQIQADGKLPWRIDPQISGGGFFFDLASHTFDFLDFALGPITKAIGLSANQSGLYKAEDIVAATFEFSSGVIGNGLWCFSVSSGTETETIEIVGDEGRIEFSTFSQNPIRLESADGLQTFQPEVPQHVHLPLVETIVDDLLQRGTCPSTGVSAARSSWVMDEIIKGA
jgi:predicted dehydrogenase